MAPASTGRAGQVERKIAAEATWLGGPPGNGRLVGVKMAADYRLGL